MFPNVRGETITTQSEGSSEGAPVLFVWGLLKEATHATFRRAQKNSIVFFAKVAVVRAALIMFILAEGAIALSVTLSGGALFAS